MIDNNNDLLSDLILSLTRFHRRFYDYEICVVVVLRVRGVVSVQTCSFSFFLVCVHLCLIWPGSIVLKILPSY